MTRDQLLKNHNFYAAGLREQPYLCTHTGCRAETSVDSNSVEIWVTRGVVRKVVDSPIRVGDNVSPLTHHQPRDVQAYTQHQHSQHCQITGHTEETERQTGEALEGVVLLFFHSH